MSFFSRFFNGYNKKLFLYYFVIFALFVLAVTLFQYQREKQYKVKQQNLLLDAYSKIIESEIGNNKDSVLLIAHAVEHLPDTSLRVTIINKDGTVLFDSFYDDYENMENHLHRDEIVEAANKGVGSSIRFSRTTKIEYFYHARDCGSYFVRTAMPFDKQLMLLLKADTLYIYFMFLIFIVGAVVLMLISDRISHSIRQLEDFARRAGNNENIDVHFKFPNNELGEIGQQIVQIYQSLKEAQDELAYEKEKLFKHLHTSREGLAIFSKDKKEILANNYFIQYANSLADEQVVWSDEIFRIPEFEQLNAFLNENLESQFTDEYGVLKEKLKIKKGNGTYLVNCIIFSDKTFEIAINDISEVEQRDTLKREITSNISHELRTPVSSIQGYLETLVNNSALPEDKRQFFLKRSHMQSIRLAQLIKDISELNKIEEAGHFYAKEIVNINEVVANAIADVHLVLQMKNMEAHSDLKSELRIVGIHTLIYSVFRNLIDNSINYAGDDVEIHIECYREDESFYYFKYYDTGKGVPEEHMHRIFERFYRVDSGRARVNGGTGLGLAIVKNAIVLHGGQISVKNHVGSGLEFLFTLQKVND